MENSRPKSHATSDMTAGSPLRHILNFALPLICGYVLQQMYLVTDSAIVGRYIGVQALASVGASSSIMFLIMGFCNGSCAGFAIPVAQAFGARDYRQMRQYVAGGVRLSLALSVVMTAVCTLLCTPILQMVNTPADIFADAYTFLFITFLGIPLTVSYNLLSSLIRALGNSRTPFYFLILSSLLNALLAFCFIAVVGLGVEGSALATLLSQAAASWWCWLYICRRMRLLLPSRRERRYSHGHTVTLLLNGVPMGLQFSITAIGSIMLQGANNALGTTAVAAFTAAMRIKYLFTCVFENLGVAMATYCGQNIGAGEVRRIALGIRDAIALMMVYALATMVVIHFFADDLTRLFVSASETEIIDGSVLFLQLSSYFYPVLGLLTIFRYSIQGLGRSDLALFSGVNEMVARTAVSIFLVPALGYLGVCWNDPIAWTAADIFLLPAFIVLYRSARRRHSPFRPR